MSKAQFQWYVRSSGEALASIKQVPLWKEGLLPEVGKYHVANPPIFASVLGHDQERSRPLRESLSFANGTCEFIQATFASHSLSCKLQVSATLGISVTCPLLQVGQVVGTCARDRRKWFFMGKRMSPKCVVAVLGIGNFRTARLISGGKDRRFRIWGGVSLMSLSMFYALKLVSSSLAAQLSSK